MTAHTGRHAGLPDGLRVLERGWLSSNNILFTQGNRAIVDTGYHSHRAQTVALVREALGPQGPGLLVNTHLHSDHCGGNHALQSAWPGLPTLVPPGQADAVRQWDAAALSYEPTGQTCERFTISGVLPVGGQVRLGLDDWQVHAAPGHDPHAVVLFEPASATLISGDALWENGFGVVFPELEGGCAFQQVADTLDLIERLAPRSVIPGHGPPFTTITQALATARQRLAAQRLNPRRHAAHAAKVLVKFHLLEHRRVLEADLMAWAARSPYFATIARVHFDAEPVPALVARLLGELLASAAARREGQWLLDA